VFLTRLTARPTHRRNFRPKDDPRERRCVNNHGGPFFGHVVRGGEIAHKDSAPPAQTGGGPLKRILISDCCCPQRTIARAKGSTKRMITRASEEERSSLLHMDDGDLTRWRNRVFFVFQHCNIFQSAREVSINTDSVFRARVSQVPSQIQK